MVIRAAFLWVENGDWSCLSLDLRSSLGLPLTGLRMVIGTAPHWVNKVGRWKGQRVWQGHCGCSVGEGLYALSPTSETPFHCLEDGAHGKGVSHGSLTGTFPVL